MPKQLSCLYTNIWKRALWELLEWDEQRTDNWANKYRDAMEDEESFFFHYTALYYVTPLLCPRALMEKNDATFALWLWNALEEAICGGNYNFEDLHDADWTAARNRVESLLAKFGYSLAYMKQEHDSRKLALSRLPPIDWS